MPSDILGCDDMNDMSKYIQIVNVKQAHLYIKNGLNPVAVYWGRDRVVYLFDKEKSKPLFDLWREYKLC